jgi:carbonic anhydrase/acetyltransferase-like protein (isoleucine patch superfamily)
MPIESFEKQTPRVHPSAFIHPAATVIGEVELGEEASVWPSAVLRGDQGPIFIGARTSFQDGAVAHATGGMSHTRLGAECTIGHQAVLHGCQVGDRCLIGIGAIVLDNVEVGELSFVAAGSLLTPRIKFPPRSFIMGTPGKRLREVTAKEIDWITHSWQTYQNLVRRYRAG